MRKESPELLVMTRSLGNQLAALREAAAIVQQQVAHKTGYSRSSVAKAEAGRQLLTREFWQTVDELFKAEGALLASYEQVRAAKQEYEAKCREAELAQAYAEARAHAQTLQTAARSSFTDVVQDASGLVVPAGPAAWCGVSRLAPGAAVGSVAAVDRERTVDSAGELASRRFPGSVAGQVPADRDAEVRDQLVSLLCEWIGAMNRRELIELLGRAAAIISAASPMVAALDTDEVERLARALALPSRVDTKVIDHLEAIFREIKRREDTLGPHAVLATAVAEQGLVHTLLGECPEALRPRLLSVYSDMSTSIGYYYFDCEDVENAVYHWDQARSAAQNAKNIELSIYALGNMHYAAAWQGKNHTAIDLAAAAQNLMSKTGDPLMRVDAHLVAARAHALDGQYTACLVEFENALDVLLANGEPSAESPLYYYNEGILVSRKSECLLRLGKPQESAVSARAALALYDRSNGNSLATCALDLSNALIQCDEVDEAACAIAEAADLAVQIRSTRLVKELRTTRSRMQPWQDTRAVRELDDHLVAYGLLKSDHAGEGEVGQS